jgi:peptidoglycan/LPS O-acetylase OafA/YrhL
MRPEIRVHLCVTATAESMNQATEIKAQDRLIFLDGLRGWAALIVVMCHLFPFFLLRSNGPSAEWAHGFLAHGFLAHIKYALASLFLVWYRFMTDGIIPVYVFFVLSGFVLSAGFVKSRSFEAISHQALRRYIRLAVPIFVACLFAYILMRTHGMYNQRAGTLVNSDWMTTWYRWMPNPVEFLRFSFVDLYFDYSDDRTLSFVFWTIQVELFGSFLLFSTLAFFGNQKRRIYLYLFVMAVTGFLKPQLTSFIVGLCLAEFHASRHFISISRSRVVRLTLGVLTIPVVASPILMFHYFDRSALPILGTLTATLIVASALVFKGFQAVLSSRLSRFMGNISFSLYLLHPLVICSLVSWYVTIQHGQLSRPMLIVSAAVLALFTSIAAARAFVFVDNAGVKLSRRFSIFVLAPTDPPNSIESVTVNAPSAVSAGVSQINH